MIINLKQNEVVNLVPLLTPSDNDVITVEFEQQPSTVFVGWSNSPITTVEQLKANCKPLAGGVLCRRSVKYKTGMHIAVVNTSSFDVDVIAVIDNDVVSFF